MKTGTVKFFNEEKRYGFITPDDGSKDIFMHKSGLRDTVYENDKVEYEEEQGDKGINATNVRKV